MFCICFGWWWCFFVHKALYFKFYANRSELRYSPYICIARFLVQVLQMIYGKTEIADTPGSHFNVRKMLIPGKGLSILSILLVMFICVLIRSPFSFPIAINFLHFLFVLCSHFTCDISTNGRSCIHTKSVEGPSMDVHFVGKFNCRYN